MSCSSVRSIRLEKPAENSNALLSMRLQDAFGKTHEMHLVWATAESAITAERERLGQIYRAKIESLQNELVSKLDYLDASNEPEGLL